MYFIMRLRCWLLCIFLQRRVYYITVTPGFEMAARFIVSEIANIVIIILLTFWNRDAWARNQGLMHIYGDERLAPAVDPFVQILRWRLGMRQGI